MNIFEKFYAIQFNLAMSRYGKNLEKTKVAAQKRDYWEPETLRKNEQLWKEEHHSIVYQSWMPDDSKLTLSNLSLTALKKSLQATVKDVKTKIVHDQRKKYWDNVFWFIDHKQSPAMVGLEYFLCDPDESKCWFSIASFAYPVESYTNRHGVEREFPIGDYELYEGYTEEIKSRIGKELVYVEPVGFQHEDFREVPGIIGKLGFRIWVGDGDGVPLFHEEENESHFNRTLKHRVLVVSPIQRLEGFLDTCMVNTIVAGTRDMDGVFNIITVASSTTNAKGYMARADEIREAIGVPGLMISYSSLLSDPDCPVDVRCPSNRTSEADKDGVHYTTFTFYSGDETEVKISEVDLDENGEPASVVSGFMPIHAVSKIPTKYKPRDKPE